MAKCFEIRSSSKMNNVTTTTMRKEETQTWREIIERRDLPQGKRLRKKRSGRILICLVAFLVIILDSRSYSLISYRGQDFCIQHDAKQVSQIGVPLESVQCNEQDHHWFDYEHRTNDTNFKYLVSSIQGRIFNEHSRATNTEGFEPLPIIRNLTVETFLIEAENPSVFAHDNNSQLLKSSNISTGNVSRHVTTEEIVNKSSDQCLLHNTKAWIEGHRLENADHNLTNDFIYKQNLIENPLHPHSLTHATSQTICHTDSRFRNPSTGWDITNEQMLDEWTFRLIYMAIHHHQHAPAVAEAQARQACPRSLNISKMDYECPSTKFLVSNIASIGLGASFRLGAVSSILMAIATNRVAVFVNNLDGGPEFLQEPCRLASCPRHDIQCFYLPITPCSLLVKDLQNATVLPEINARDLRRHGKLEKPEYLTPRIIAVEPRITMPSSWGIQVKIRSRLYSIVMKMIDGIRGSAPEVQIDFLEAAALRIMDDNATVDSVRGYDASFENTTEYMYGNRYTKSAHAALMYLMRPSPKYQRTTDEVVASIVPDDLNRSLSIGLPIRGSDKCEGESACYSFDTYMSLMRQTWDKELNPDGALVGVSQGNIILTTEDEKVLAARLAYESNGSFPYRFIINDNDVLQGSGSPNSFMEHADSVMFASIVSLKLQLQAKYTFGNCCSNFHMVLFDILYEGCGAIPNVRLICLQEHPNPQYRICCGWSRSTGCDQLRGMVSR